MIAFAPLLVAAQAAIGRPAPLDYKLAAIAPVAAEVAMESLKRPKGLVMFFFSEQCGVTFYYKERLQAVVRDFEPRGMQFVGVRCGRREDPGQPIDLAEARYLKIPYFDDVKGDMVKAYGVGQSLTFAVIDSSGTLRYLGGFDDQVNSKLVKQNYLRDAIRAVAAGKPVARPTSRPIGCAIIPIQPAQ